jgi:hypothetical protein
MVKNNPRLGGGWVVGVVVDEEYNVEIGLIMSRVED